jgi:hypothetical protein
MGIDDESSHPELCSEVADSVTRIIVCLFREPDAGNPPVRFDEREQETEPSQTGLRRRRESFVSSHRETKATAPVLDSTQNSTVVRALRGLLSVLLCYLVRHVVVKPKQHDDGRGQERKPMAHGIVGHA